MKLLPVFATAFFILLVTPIALSDSFNDTFDTITNWSNSSLFGSTPAQNYAIDSGAMKIWNYGRIHTTNSSLNVAKPYLFSIEAKDDTAGASEIKLTDSTGNQWVYISLNWADDSVTVISDGVYCKSTYTGIPYPFSDGNWYNITLITGNPAELLIDGNHFLYLDLGGCSPSTYVFLGASGAYGDSRFDNLYWYPYTETGYNILDAGVFSAIEYDEHGCNRELNGSSISIYNGLTGQLLATKTPTDIEDPNCCEVLNTTYSCTLGRFFIPKSWSYIYAVVHAPNYQNETANFTMPYSHMGMNFFLIPENIYRYNGKVIDRDTLQPINNALVCVFYSNNTLATNCMSTSNIGEFFFYLYKNTEYYISVTGPIGYECSLTEKFSLSGNSYSAIYYLKQDPRPWEMELSSDLSSGSNGTAFTFRLHYCRISGLNNLDFRYQAVSRYLNVDTVLEGINVVSNPVFFTRQFPYCGEHDVWMTAVDNNGTWKDSNHLTITISEPCEEAPGLEEPIMNMTPYADLTGYLPEEAEWVNYFFTPPIFISIFVFGIAGLVASKIGGEKKGLIFLVSSIIIFFVLSITGVLPKWILIILTVGGGLLILQSIARHKEGEG